MDNSQKTNSDFKQDENYISLSVQGKYIFDLICNYIYNYSKKDYRFRNYVCIFRILIFLLAMVNTIILGIKYFSDINCQVNIGLILSALITFFTTIAAFFNFDQYWMKNRIIHIELCKMLDNFIFEVISNQMDDDRLKSYMKKLDEVQDKNIDYWENASQNINTK